MLAEDAFEHLPNQAQPRVIRLGGRLSKRQSPGPEGGVLVADGLARFIYTAYYLDDRPALRRLAAGELDIAPVWALEDSEFVASLRAAGAGAGTIEPGWHVERRSGVGWCVEKGGVRLWAADDEIIASSPPIPGASISVRFPNDRPYASPGFFTVLGDAGLPDVRHRAIVRLYMNAAPNAAPALVAHISAALRAEGLPFMLKVVNDPRRFSRPDAAVLYLEREHFPLGRSLVATFADVAHAGLRPAVPALAKRLAPGIAVAEEPQGRVVAATSFGQHRCSLIARALGAAFAANQDSADARYEEILRAFRSMGLNPERPYLNTGSVDEFAPIGAANVEYEGIA